MFTIVLIKKRVANSFGCFRGRPAKKCSVPLPFSKLPSTFCGKPQPLLPPTATLPVETRGNLTRFLGRLLRAFSWWPFKVILASTQLPSSAPECDFFSLSVSVLKTVTVKLRIDAGYVSKESLTLRAPKFKVRGANEQEL